MKPEALKELQEAVAILTYAKDDITNLGEDIENTLKHIRAAIFMETPSQSMKFNIYDFTDDDNGTRPIMGCVHHQEGFKVASDSHLLIAVKDSYPEELEGKSIDKKGETSEYKYPNWKALFSDRQKEAREYSIDFGKLTNFNKEYATERKMKGKRGIRPAYVKIGPAFFKLELLTLLSKFMKDRGVDTLHIEDSRKAAACFAADGSMGLIMPTIATAYNYHDLRECWDKKSSEVIFYEVA